MSAILSMPQCDNANIMAAETPNSTRVDTSTRWEFAENLAVCDVQICYCPGM